MDTASSFRAKLVNSLPKATSPMMTAARPMTMAPRPMLISEEPWNWASRPPERATRPLDTMRPSTTLALVLMPWARAMLGLAPVARREQPFSVPKNQYKTAMSITVNTTSRGRGLSRLTVRTYRWDTSRSYLSTPTA